MHCTQYCGSLPYFDLLLRPRPRRDRSTRVDSLHFCSDKTWDAAGHPCQANHASGPAHHLQRLLPPSAGTPARRQETSSFSPCLDGGSTNTDPVRASDWRPSARWGNQAVRASADPVLEVSVLSAVVLRGTNPELDETQPELCRHSKRKACVFDPSCCFAVALTVSASDSVNPIF